MKPRLSRRLVLQNITGPQPDDAGDRCAGNGQRRIGMGGFGGISAIYLVRHGFTGAPAISIEGGDVKHFCMGLGMLWRSLEQYIKKSPVCRWAQTSVEAVFQLKTDNAFEPESISVVKISTFHEAWRLCTRAPKSTEEVRHSLPISVGTTPVHGNICAIEIGPEWFSDSVILKLIIHNPWATWGLPVRKGPAARTFSRRLIY
jgi:2-methylcitrate dehydratase PrpD